jgi:hypothetical protein
MLDTRDLIRPSTNARTIAGVKFVRPIQFSQHRLKRLAAWAMLMLAWMMAALHSAAPAKGRHARQRCGVSLDRLARMICALIALHAAKLPRGRRRPFQPLRPFAPRGFAQRRTQRHVWRSAFGSALRRRLYARDPRQRIAKLSAALRDLEGIATAFARRMNRGFTRLKPIILVRPPQERVCALAAPAANAVDSS